jgi:alpha-L-rhamnosidase
VTASTVTNIQIGVSPCAPVRKQQEIALVQMTEPRPGVYVFNLGQNIAGSNRTNRGQVIYSNRGHK